MLLEWYKYEVYTCTQQTCLYQHSFMELENHCWMLFDQSLMKNGIEPR